MKKNLYLLLLLFIALLAAAALMSSCTPNSAPETKNYTITFWTNGGSDAAALTAAGGSTVAEPQAPVKENSIFDGWYKDAGLTQAWNFAADTVTADITLYARWADAAYVIIADGGGALVLCQKPVKLIDRDNNGSFSIDEVLYMAHETYYNGGASAGYAAATTQWGLGITKLWGDASGSYGFYQNNAMSLSLDDSVTAGDYLYAYVFSDTAYWSDAYSFFDVNTSEIAAGGNITLTLTYIGFDSDWNPAPAPAADATIFINGAASSYSTNARGEAVLTFLEAGNYLISAKSDSLVLVPPICIVKVR